MLNRLKRAIAAFRQSPADSTPLIWTTLGNVPIDSLTHAVEWVETEDYIKLIETFRHNNETVKQSAHIRLKKGLAAFAEQQQL